MRTIRDAFKGLTRSPGLALAAIVCLALGSAAATAIATLADVALVRPLPFPDAPRLARVWLDEADVDDRLSLSIPEARDLLAAGSFDALLITARVRTVALLRDGAERLRGEGVNDGYFEALGLRAPHGRLLEPRDHAPGAPPAMVLSHGAWMRAFGGDPAAIGSSLRTERAAYTVVGIAPRRFTGTVEADVVDFWIPLEHYEPVSMRTDRAVRQTWTIGRLRPGTTLAAAQAELEAIGAAWRRTWPEMYRQRVLRAEPFGESWRGSYRQGVAVMAVASVALLAIAGINVGCLLVARVLDRRRELAVRAALGASPWRVGRLLLVEAALVAAIGGALGILVGTYLLDAFLAVSPVTLPPYLDLTPDGRTVAVSVGALVLAGLLAGAAPVLVGGRVGPGEALKESGRGTVGRPVERRWIGVLVAAEVALTLTLLVSGGLLIRTYERLNSYDLGYKRDGIARLAVTFGRADAGEPGSRHLLFERVRAAVAAYPGVEAVGLVAPTLPPWDGERARVRFTGLDTVAAPEGVEVGMHYADGGLLPALGVEIVNGRNIDATDGPGGAPIAVVSEALARRMGGSAAAVGREIEFVNGDPAAGRFRVVGVASDVAYGGLGELGTARYNRAGSAGAPRRERLDVYVPLARFPLTTISIAAATAGDAAALVEPLRREIGRIAPASAVHWTSTMEDEVGLEYAPTRFYALLVGAFSASALVLTSVGLFALLSHAAARRASEMGIRLALGATPRQVAALLLRGGLAPVAMGAVAGLLGALWASAAMRGLLYDVSASDGRAFAGALAALTLVSLAAGLIPARRAASVDPAAIMKGE